MKTHYSARELAAMNLAGYPIAKKNWLALAAREEWESRPRAGRGGGFEYAPPAPILKLIRLKEKNEAALANPSPEQQVLAAIVSNLADLQTKQEAVEAERRQKGEAILRDLAGGISPHAALSLNAHCAIAEGWQVWFAKAQQPINKSASWALYAHAYNLGEIPVSKAVREAFPDVSGRSVQRWVGVYQKGNLAALADRRNGTALAGKTVFSATPLLAAAAKKLMLDRPGIRTGQLHELLKTASTDRDSGEQLFNPPSYDQVRRYQQTWIDNNRELYLQATNPDAWKNQSLLAYGSCSEDVHGLNDRWEMDATPADWLLLDTDGKKKRHTVSVIIDIWSRRMLVVVARTPRTETHCFALRLALLLWGVPKEILTDNGQDYQSEHFKHVLQALGITHVTTQPFSPEEKPHVERAIGTLNHSILELLPHFSGHSVADRKAIEARRSFADRLARKGELVDFGELGIEAMTAEVMQERINTWLAGIYEQREHAGIAMSPFEKAASWTGEVRRITSERSLDLLLAKPANGGQRTVQKKGIRLDGTWFQAADLALIDVGSVVDVYETPDLGRIVVYFRKNFVCIAEAPERTGADRQQIAVAASKIQRERLAEQKKRLKAETKGLAPTAEVLDRLLADKAAAAGKLVLGDFGKASGKSSTHSSHGLAEAGKASDALAGPKPSSRAAELSAQAARAMAEAPTNVAALPAAHAHATPLAGLTNREKYELWLQYDALVKAHGGDVEVLEEAWQRRFYVGFQTIPEFRAEQNMAKARKETGTR
ncbi:transposase family protein [Accumulibacter sp.]|uniref:transposase family protein n=1 Tax=Accumulibacter sp. TaxID=2053492 RepID=UPI00261731B2|nr:transposase family protein [Accumulibacter sp.]